MEKNIAVLAPNGWGIKNFLYNDFVDILSKEAKIYFFTPVLEREDIFIKTLKQNLYFEKLEIPQFNSVQNHIFDILTFAQYFRTPNNVSKTYLYKYPTKSKKAFLIKKAKTLIAKYFGKKIGFDFQEKIERQLLKMEKYVEKIKFTLKEKKIDFLFSTVPLISYYEHPALFAAKDLGIKTACIITSWDNLESKGRFPIKFDHYFCWNFWMKEELKNYYPFIKDEQITISGPPQFDYYYKKELIVDKGDFFNELKADINKKLILWAGVSPNIFPNEDIVFEEFYELFKNSEIYKKAQILLRPHPIGGLKRFESIIKKYPDIICIETNSDDPKFLLKWAPSIKDIKILVNVIFYSDVVVNNCSTITLDAFVLNKPVINIAYDSEKDSKLDKYIKNSYSYEYYSPLVELKSVKLAYSNIELLENIDFYLNNPMDGIAERKKALLMQIEYDDGKASQRIAKKILELL